MQVAYGLQPRGLDRGEDTGPRPVRLDSDLQGRGQVELRHVVLDEVEHGVAAVAAQPQAVRRGFQEGGAEAVPHL